MSRMNYRRITDRNESLHGLGMHVSFEAGFYISEEGAIIFSGRVIDSNERELFCSRDLSSLNEFCLELYQKWNPIEDLQYFATEIEVGNIQNEPVYFSTAMHEMTLEVKGPVAMLETYGVVVHMSTGCLILGEYHLKDSGLISVSLLCKKECLLQVLKDLQTDLLQLLSYGNAVYNPI